MLSGRLKGNDLIWIYACWVDD